MLAWLMRALVEIPSWIRLKVTTAVICLNTMKTIIASLTISLAYASAWAVPVSYGGHYYDVISAPGITWADARVAALSSSYLGLEGHLVTITSAGENLAVGGLIATAGLGEAWAGGYQDPLTETDPQTGWTWVNGEGTFPGFNGGSTYANWNLGEPNDFYGPGSEQYLGLNLGGTGGFNDEGNLGLITGYVIEYDPNTIVDVSVPDGGSTGALLAGAVALLGTVSRRLRK